MKRQTILFRNRFVKIRFPQKFLRATARGRECEWSHSAMLLDAEIRCLWIDKHTNLINVDHDQRHLCSFLNDMTKPRDIQRRPVTGFPVSLSSVRLASSEALKKISHPFQCRRRQAAGPVCRIQRKITMVLIIGFIL